MSRSVLNLTRAVPLREWPAVLASLMVASVVEIGLRTLRLPRLARSLGVPLSLGESGPMPPGGYLKLSPRSLLRMRASARVMRHWPFGDTCLRNALVTGQRLRRLDPILRVGVAKDHGVVRAHAWLEISGVSLDPGAPSVFSLLQPMPQASEAAS